MENNTQEIKLHIPAVLSELDGILEKTESLMEPAHATMRNIKAVQVSIEEIFVNVCSYAYPEDYTGERYCEINWKLETFADKARITVEIRDHGNKFDPVAKEDPDITLKIEQRRIGGMGILMVKKFMDRVTYEYKDDQNILLIEKEWQFDI